MSVKTRRAQVAAFLPKLKSELRHRIAAGEKIGALYIYDELKIGSIEFDLRDLVRFDRGKHIRRFVQFLSVRLE